MKLALTALFFLTAHVALAADTANLDFGHFMTSYEVELTDGGLVGSQQNIGNGSGEVELKWSDGNWSGRFGFNQITSHSTKERSETKMTYEFSVLPGGNYIAYVERKADKLEVTLHLPNGGMASSTLKNGKYLNGWNRAVTMDLKRDSAGSYSGLTQISNGRAIETADTTLEAAGALDPEILATSDLALYVILYVLPYNYLR